MERTRGQKIKSQKQFLHPFDHLFSQIFMVSFREVPVTVLNDGDIAANN